jgi:tetratricopeptide (TPR) repeat protein
VVPIGNTITRMAAEEPRFFGRSCEVSMTTLADQLAQALQCHQAGRLQEAEQLYLAILQADPHHVDALQLYGMVALQSGRAEVAVNYLREALRHKPDYAEVHNNLSNILAGQGKLDEAIAGYREAIRLKPAYAEAHHNLGRAFKDRGRLAEAAASWREAVRLMPGFADAHSNLGNVLRELGQPVEAAVACREAIRLRPDLAEAHNNLGNALQDLDLLAEAAACFQEAIRLKPAFAAAHSNLGIALKDLGRPEQAAAACREAIRLQPELAEAHFNLGCAYLLAGDFAQGWAEYEWRWRCQILANHAFRISRPLWDGTPLNGRTILLHAEQGLGDTLQFIRYAPLVKARGGRVIVACQQPLLTLLRGAAGIDEVVTDGAPVPSHDVHAPLLSLPRIFGDTLATIPGCVPYLTADPELVLRWRREMSAEPGLRVGIVWQGNPRFALPQFRPGDRRRSFALAQFEPLARLGGVRLFSLQKGHGIEQLAQWGPKWGIIDLAERLHDFSDTAAVMMNLDLIVTADTAPAHLAGALGRPVWTALPFSGCWRWLLRRDDTPWYPTMRLFRQKEPGNWDEVFKRIAAALPGT